MSGNNENYVNFSSDHQQPLNNTETRFITGGRLTTVQLGQIDIAGIAHQNREARKLGGEHCDLKTSNGNQHGHKDPKKEKKCEMFGENVKLSQTNEQLKDVMQKGRRFAERNALSKLGRNAKKLLDTARVNFGDNGMRRLRRTAPVSPEIESGISRGCGDENSQLICGAEDKNTQSLKASLRIIPLAEDPNFFIAYQTPHKLQSHLTFVESSTTAFNTDDKISQISCGVPLDDSNVSPLKTQLKQKKEKEKLFKRLSDSIYFNETIPNALKRRQLSTLMRLKGFSNDEISFFSPPSPPSQMLRASSPESSKVSPQLKSCSKESINRTNTESSSRDIGKSRRTSSARKESLLSKVNISSSQNSPQDIVNKISRTHSDDIESIEKEIALLDAQAKRNEQSFIETIWKQKNKLLAATRHGLMKRLAKQKGVVLRAQRQQEQQERDRIKEIDILQKSESNKEVDANYDSPVLSRSMTAPIYTDSSDTCEIESHNSAVNTFGLKIPKDVVEFENELNRRNCSENSLKKKSSSRAYRNSAFRETKNENSDFHGILNASFLLLTVSNCLFFLFIMHLVLDYVMRERVEQPLKSAQRCTAEHKLDNPLPTFQPALPEQQRKYWNRQEQFHETEQPNYFAEASSQYDFKATTNTNTTSTTTTTTTSSSSSSSSSSSRNSGMFDNFETQLTETIDSLNIVPDNITGSTRRMNSLRRNRNSNTAGAASAPWANDLTWNQELY